MSHKMKGEIEVWVNNEGEGCERRVYAAVTGLPGWLLGMLRDAGPLAVSGSTYSLDRPDKTGPHSVLLRAARVYVAVDGESAPSQAEEK